MTCSRKQEHTRNFGEEVSWKAAICTDEERQVGGNEMLVIVRGCGDFNVAELGWRLAVLSEKLRQCYMKHCDINLRGLAAQCHGLNVSVSMAQTVNSRICRVCLVPYRGELRHTVATARTVVAVCCSCIYCVGHCRRTRTFPA